MEKRRLEQAARKAAAEASAKSASHEEEEAIITSYNHYVAAKGAGRQASIVGPEWTAYKAKHADKVRWCYSRAGYICTALLPGSPRQDTTSGANTRPSLHPSDATGLDEEEETGASGTDTSLAHGRG